MQPHEQPDHDHRPPSRRGPVLTAVAVGLLIVVIVVLHLTGIVAQSH